MTAETVAPEVARLEPAGGPSLLGGQDKEEKSRGRGRARFTHAPGVHGTRGHEKQKAARLTNCWRSSFLSVLICVHFWLIPS